MKKIALFMVLGIITLASCNAKEAGNKTAQNEINKKKIIQIQKQKVR